VSRRSAEIGVRIALGAKRSQVVWMVLRGSLLLCATGVVMGVPLAMAFERSVRVAYLPAFETTVTLARPFWGKKTESAASPAKRRFLLPLLE
jgi:hypothetical protein